MTKTFSKIHRSKYQTDAPNFVYLWDEQITMYGESLNPISHSISPHFLNNQTLQPIKAQLYG